MWLQGDSVGGTIVSQCVVNVATAGTGSSPQCNGVSGLFLAYKSTCTESQ